MSEENEQTPEKKDEAPGFFNDEEDQGFKDSDSGWTLGERMP